MVASALFSLSSRFTLGAVCKIFIALRILKKFVLCFSIVFFATLAFVPSHATFKAHLKAACTANRGFAALA